MPLSVVTTPTPGATSLNGTNLQGSSVGQKAASPSLTPPSNTIPSNMAAPTKDLSGIYANVNGTIYSKSTGQAFSTPQEFAQSAGIDPNNINWSNLKFDTTWKPQATTPSTPPQTNNGILPTLASNNSSPSTSTSTGNPTTQTNSYYTPPNQGTTGVSQGGLIGNLVTNAINNPNYEAAINKYNSDVNEASTKEANAVTPNLSSANTGIQGLLGQIYNQKIANDLAAVNASISSQGATTSGLSAATSANAPITAGAYTSPSAASTTGQTTSGASSLNALVGQRPSTSNPGVTEFYNTQTGQGFSDPNALAAFVNQQVPGANVNASNVFEYLQQHGNQGISGGGGSLNPLNNISQTAQAVISGSLPYSQAISQGSSIPGYQNALNQAILSADGNLNQIQANTSGQASVLQSIPALQSANTAAKGIQNTITSYLSANPKLNPSSVNLANFAQQWLSGQFSNPEYQTLADYLNEYTSTLAPILGVGGDPTNLKTQIAQGFINGSASGASIATVLQNISSLADQKVQNLQSGALGNTTPTGGSGSFVNGQTAAGGALVFQNGQWVEAK